jgi:Ca2+-transporting ATPase
MDAAARREALAAASIVARVEPSVKVEVVEAKRAAGHVVVMTGDGVNDAPALRRADVGVAVAAQAGGTDVAREAAQLVVTDEDLGTIVAAVREGRTIFRNLLSVIGYLLAGNASEVAVVMAGLALFPELAVTLLPVQLLWVNLITDGLPAVALGLDLPPGDPLAGPPRRRAQLLGTARQARLVLQGGAIGAIVLGTGLVARASQWGAGAERSQLFLALLLCHLSLAYVARADRFAFERGWARNRWLLAAVGGSMALQALALLLPPLRAALALEPLPWQGWALAVGAAVATVALLEAGRRLAPRLHRS